jgi:hypothetical protein
VGGQWAPPHPSIYPGPCNASSDPTQYSGAAGGGLPQAGGGIETPKAAVSRRGGPQRLKQRLGLEVDTEPPGRGFFFSLGVRPSSERRNCFWPSKSLLCSLWKLVSLVRLISARVQPGSVRQIMPRSKRVNFSHSLQIPFLHHRRLV